MIASRGLAYYRSLAASSASRKLAVRALPPPAMRALNILFVCAVLALLSTLPYFAPENIYQRTSSRLQAPLNVLFSRLAGQRPLSDEDDLLKGKLVSQEGRLLYLTYGPEPLINCLYCNSDRPSSYLHYSLPSLLLPHLLHVAVLGLLTSSIFTGPLGSRWRTAFTVAGIVLAVADVSLLASYNYRGNQTALKLEHVDFFHWRMRIYRGVAIASVDAFLALLLYLSGTNRFFVSLPTAAERLESTTRVMESMKGKLQAVSLMRNMIVRDDELREKNDRHWLADKKMMGEIFEDAAVANGVRAAIGRVDVPAVASSASQYVDNIVDALAGSAVR
ncbi:MAG: hypothetical protein M1829_003763 [Trizodia sp. TS-e1964]|nr:MAG: hypothetical protein M1829_003763 [Trizodia sp. TS-e1964]